MQSRKNLNVDHRLPIRHFAQIAYGQLCTKRARHLLAQFTVVTAADQQSLSLLRTLCHVRLVKLIQPDNFGFSEK